MLASDILRLVLGLAAVIGMIGIAAYTAQKAGLGSMNAAMGRKRRLSVLESLPLDARRKLVIFKCDARQYLVVLGPAGETLVDASLEAAPAEAATEPAALENPFNRLAKIAARLRAA